MMLGIYGTGGTGREVYEIVSEMNADSEKRWDELVFIDDFTEETELYGARILSFGEAEKQYDPSVIEYIIAVGEPSSRELLYNKVKKAGYGLATIVHPDSYVFPSAELGEGVFVKMQSIISSEARLDNNVFIQANALVGHDVTIGAHSQISAYSHISGNTRLGKRCYLGVRSSVREECLIGDDVVLAMGAVVMEKQIPNSVMAMGNPAKYVRRKADSKVFS